MVRTFDFDAELAECMMTQPFGCQMIPRGSAWNPSQESICRGIRAFIVTLPMLLEKSCEALRSLSGHEMGPQTHHTFAGPLRAQRTGLTCLRSHMERLHSCQAAEASGRVATVHAERQDSRPAGLYGQNAPSSGQGWSSAVGRKRQRRAQATLEAPAVERVGEDRITSPGVPVTPWPQTPPSDFEKDDAELHTLLNSIQPLDIPVRRRNDDSTAEECEPEAKGNGFPVYVMLPLDSVWLIERDGEKKSMIKREKALDVGLRTLKRAGVEGVMVDVWWGIVEAAGPRQYDFSAYKRLFDRVAENGLKVQAVMSFHAAGGNVGDTCKIPLPSWVVEVQETEPDIFYTDATGIRNKECLSLGCDNVPLFQGRTPVDMYHDFIEAFGDVFAKMLGEVITEITIGMGPAGELRYPAYPEGDGRWRFPGVGEFQCYDKFMLADLKEKAIAVNRPEWGWGGPHDAGNYNSRAWETGFFISQGGSWDTEYGRFFLGWYSGALLQHADRILTAAVAALDKQGRARKMKAMKELPNGEMVFEFEPACSLGVKLAGVHWWFKSRAHAAELTAGYYNTRERNGYTDVMAVMAKHNARVSFTCVEMRDCEHPPEGRCSPQGLLEQIIQASLDADVPLSGENALQRYDNYAFDRIAESAFGQNARAGHLEQLTFLRMGDLMFGEFWRLFLIPQTPSPSPAALREWSDWLLMRRTY